VQVRRGALAAPSGLLLCDAATEWLAAAREGRVRTRSGYRYKPSTLRTYGRDLTATVLPELGSRRISTVTRSSLQDLVDRLVADGYGESTVHNVVLPIRSIYRWLVSRGMTAANPTVGLSLPAVRARRERFAPPRESAALLAALPESDRAIWATALYAGLRRGELLALRWQDVDFERGVIRVEHSWDRVAGFIEPKSRSGRRRVPLPETLAVFLRRHRIRQPPSASDLVFSGSGGRPIDPPSLSRRAKQAWSQAGLQPVCLHECRHSYAAAMIAAGVNAKMLSTYMGHASITVTLDRYGHLMPGNEREAAGMLDDFVVAASTATAGAAVVALR